MNELLSRLNPFEAALVKPATWLAGTLLVVVVGLILRRVLVRRYESVPGWHFRLQVLTASIGLLVLVSVVLIVPDDDLRGQLLSFLGILLSAAIALSSTTLIGNAMAGFMLRGVGGFKVGDFLRVEGHFGRVSEVGLLHTEIQTEDRDLITLPNSYLVARPIRVLQSSGTVLSATVSLGYDVPRVRVRELLLAAARDAGLEDPFVEVLDLGDYSITYRAAGLLREVKRLLTVRSALRARILDSFHGAGVEIVSPSFMNQRQIPPDEPILPELSDGAPTTATLPEAVIFDKAEAAEHMDKLRASYEELGAELADLETRTAAAPSDAERDRLKRGIERRRAHRGRLEEILRDWEEHKSRL